ncbi:FIG00678690: hypothetical protein [hydrothermal vent metagenome]|uniref:Uncharacterized protein n=1 Tax=hydrothermal vent metagenome TaxID=652676 RepID=A0A3B1A1A2_9ZZZZ
MNKQEPQSNKININVIAQNEGLCKTGIPFSVGEVTSLNQLKLYQNDIDIECFAHPLCYWLDDSIKWINLGFFHSAENSNQYKLLISKLTKQIKNSPPESQENSELQFNSDEEKLTISITEFLFVLDLKTLSLYAYSSHREKLLFKIESLGGLLTLNDSQQAVTKLNRWHSSISTSLNTGSRNALEVELDGYFEYRTNKQQLRFTTSIEFYHVAPFIKIRTSLHNPNPAKHPGGLWDLGDEGSELFDSFLFDLTLAETDKVKYQTTPNSEWQSAAMNTIITQYASGGKNWKSPTHTNKNKQVTLDKNGFDVVSDNTQTAHGDRATPVLHSTNGVGLTIEKFWQNFPTAIEINNNRLRLELFPSSNGIPHELQGGEKKTHTFWLNLSNQPNKLNWVHSTPIAQPSCAWLTQCNVLPTFSENTATDSIAVLIKTGLEHKQNFFAKRETVDEYGWRNFGDLYADHETLGYEGAELFISHYNNQYDPIYGFVRQFLLTGDPRWFELADDLANHVKDIDIYHTKDDKAEYNGGLFWHTDHYLKAYTATHRSFSKFQGSDSYEGRTGGGGPGGQHCYTTGLAYHYLLTGSKDSKRTVLTMAKWITSVYEGTNTCLELLLACKNRNKQGIKNHFNGKYPFDRGTANYVIALLDCYQLTQEAEYLLQVEHIIHNTIHPADNIDERNLSKAEQHWFYTVFLQSICRYLEIKEAENSFDNAFYYVRDALLHYADWMLLHEYPYLEKPEILEFPNDTWTAQDLRKAHILAAAFYYSADNKQKYLDQAKYFQVYVSKRLSTSIELSYTRILVLLMQNHGPLKYYESNSKDASFNKKRQDWPEANYHQPLNFGISVAKELGKRLLKLSIINEINWLKKHIRR